MYFFHHLLSTEQVIAMEFLISFFIQSLCIFREVELEEYLLVQWNWKKTRKEGKMEIRCKFYASGRMQVLLHFWCKFSCKNHCPLQAQDYLGCKFFSKFSDKDYASFLVVSGASVVNSTSYCPPTRILRSKNLRFFRNIKEFDIICHYNPKTKRVWGQKCKKKFTKNGPDQKK